MLRLVSPMIRKPVRIDLSEGPDLADEGADGSHGRSNLVDQIIALNPSATAEFLDQFDDGALGEYLDHLAAIQLPRGRDAHRTRPHGRPWVFAAAACA